MKRIIIGLLALTLAASSAFAGKNKTQSNPLDAKNAEQYATYKVLEISDGPRIKVQRTVAIPNSKKMNDKDTASETLEISYNCDALPQAQEKEFLAQTLNGQKIRVVKDAYKLSAPKKPTAVVGEIKITSSETRYAIAHGEDIVFSDGRVLADVFDAWIKEQLAKKKDTQAAR